MNHSTPATDDVTDKHYFGGPSMEHLQVCVEAVTKFLLTKLGVDSVATHLLSHTVTVVPTNAT